MHNITYEEFDDIDFFDLCRIRRKTKSVQLWDKEKNLEEILSHLEINERIEVLVAPDSGGEGRGFMHEGIEMYFHSEEKVHWGTPHVHARWNHFEMSIGIQAGTILDGDIKNRKKKKAALDYVASHKKKLLEFWNDHTNGIKVDLGSG